MEPNSKNLTGASSDKNIALVRELRGRAIAQTPDQIQRLDDRTYAVKSQAGNGVYTVNFDTLDGWSCSCPDHVHRKVKCKHSWAVELSFKLRTAVKENVLIESLSLNVCPYCASTQIVKHGLRHNKYGLLQRFNCRNCGKRFTHNFGFEHMQASPDTITSAMQLYFSGESLRAIQKFLKLKGFRVSHVTVYNWIGKYVRLMDKYLDKITPQVSDTWRADEMFLKIKGNPKYLYALIDDETRYWIAKEVAGDKFSHEAAGWASQLFGEGQRVAGKKPQTLITDGLHAYHEAYMREFYTRRKPRIEHVQHVTWKKEEENNRKMERFNGEIRDREKVMRSLKKEDTPILTGYQIYHNYIRPHMGLDGKTPAELAGIKVEGENKWLTLIQNAARK